MASYMLAACSLAVKQNDNCPKVGKYYFLQRKKKRGLGLEGFEFVHPVTSIFIDKQPYREETGRSQHCCLFVASPRRISFRYETQLTAARGVVFSFYFSLSTRTTTTTQRQAVSMSGGKVTRSPAPSMPSDIRSSLRVN